MATNSEATLWLDALCDGALDLTADNVGLAKKVRSMLRPPEPESLSEGYLSPHFTLAELTYSNTANAEGIDNTPDQARETRDRAKRRQGDRHSSELAAWHPSPEHVDLLL